MEKNKLLIEGFDYPLQKASRENSVISDPVTAAAQQAFGITYLFPWQRIVIANILDAAVYYNNKSVREDIQSDEVLFDERDENKVSAKDLFSNDENIQVDESLPEEILFKHAFPAAEKTETESTKISINNSDESNDTETYGKQIVLLPTGAGKSLCFLTPALLLQGPTLILYPLLALMADQKRRMDEGGLKNVVFRGGQSEEERNENFKKLKNGAKIILANPEVLQNETLLEKLSSCGIFHIAIDEAHVSSEWGDTFRPAYLTLGAIIKKLKVPVVTAFTATASPEVLSRISEILFDGHAHIVRSDSDRPNIHYEVINTFAKKRTAFKLALERPKPLIIFCGTRKKSEDMARELAAFMGDDVVKFYHAGLSKEEKTAVEKWFYPKTDAVLCCTCAFGMGIDKKDIHTVIHLEPSPSAESYIQEAGRGGRDGSVADAILLWSKADSLYSSQFPSNSRERVLGNFAEAESCRRQILLNALGGEEAACDGCDICNRGSRAPYAEDALLALKYIKLHRKSFSEEEINSKLTNLFNRRNSKFNISIWEHSDTEEILSQLKSDKKIHRCVWPWKNKIDIGKMNKLETKILNAEKKAFAVKQKIFTALKNPIRNLLP